MIETVKPVRLRTGDTVALVSPSWGGPHAHPKVFELGQDNLEREFGLRIKEFPTARMSDEELYADPKARADDINAAFADPEVRAVIASIGGYDSVRILPFIDFSACLGTPKVVLGYSDTTTITTALNLHGLVTFNGPSVMAGFAQLRHLPRELSAHVRRVLMEPCDRTVYTPFPEWCEHYLRWDMPNYDGEVGRLVPHDGWRWLQPGRAVGALFGGCIEVLEFMKGTRFWPEPDFWDGRILFVETSEEKPSPANVGYMLRNYGMMGVFDRIAGLLIGRARDYAHQEKEELYELIKRIVSFEFGRPHLPIAANLDFGHTDPQWIMPLGCRFEFDSDRQSMTLVEPAVI